MEEYYSLVGRATLTTHDLDSKSDSFSYKRDIGIDAGCWHIGEWNRELCCDTAKYGTWGNQECWTHGFSYTKCCQDAFAVQQQREVRDILLLASELHPEGIPFEKMQQIALHVRAWAHDELESNGPIATVAALLRAFLPDSGSPESAQALSIFLSLERPLISHIESGWAVFALFAALAFGRTDTQYRGHVGYVPTEKDRHTCLNGCSSSPRDCVFSCVGAASALPSVHIFQRDPEKQSNISTLRTQMLSEAEVSLRSLVVSRDDLLILPHFWAALQELQSKLFFRASCPEGAFLYHTSAEPPYEICLPLSEPSKQGITSNSRDRELLKVMLRHGRWRDCDFLRDAAILSGMAPCMSSLRGVAGPLCIVVDVGSALGTCSSYALALGFRVVAFDPALRNVALLRASAWKAEERGFLEAQQLAAWDSDGFLNTAGSSWERWAGQGDTEIMGVRLDHVIGGQNHIIMKVDVEGSEKEVLRGAAGLFMQKRIRAVLLEVHCLQIRERGFDPWEPVEALLNYGFVVIVREPKELMDKSIATPSDLKTVEYWLLHRDLGSNVGLLAHL